MCWTKPTEPDSISPVASEFMNSSSLSRIKRLARLYLTAKFPHYPVRFESVDDDPDTIGVGVFGVDRSARMTVRRCIFDLDATLAAPKGLIFIPMVRDLETTMRHYPDMITA